MDRALDFSQQLMPADPPESKDLTRAGAGPGPVALHCRSQPP